jgi:predicted TIM-barrel fold metal-dependent hydrolase
MKNELSRRKFFGAAGMLTGIALPWGKFEKSLTESVSLGEMPRVDAPPKGRIVDMHMHYGYDKPDWLDSFLKLSDRLNYTACVLTPFPYRKAIAEAAKKYPKQIIPFGALELDAPDVLDQVKEFHELGYRGLGEISGMQRNCSDQKYFPIYELASQYKWILMFHTGIVGRDNFNVSENVGSGRMRPIFLEEIARQFPQLIVLGAHLGNPEYEWAGEVTRWNPNVYFDLSGTTLPKMAGRLNEFRKIFWWGDVEWEAQPGDDPSPYCKIVFGTDTNMKNIDTVIGRYQAMFDACDVPEKTRKMIMGGTMAKLLNLVD